MIINPYIFSPLSSCVPVVGTNAQIGTLSTTSFNNPAYGLFNYSVSGNIYTSGSLGTSKQITGIQIFPAGFTTPYSFTNQEIWMGQITNGAFGASPQVNFSDLTFTQALTQVKASFTYTVSTNGAWQNINFDNNFCYDGVNNLILVWRNYDGSWSSGYGNWQVANVVNRSMNASSDPAFPTGTGTRTNFPLLIKLNY